MNINSDWPLGDDDLFVEPLFHMTGCKEIDLAIAMPSPIFVSNNILKLIFSYFCSISINSSLYTTNP